MNDWRQTGADLEEEWIRQRQNLPEKLEQHIQRVSEAMPMLGAVIRHNRGQADAIQKVLRGDDPLTADDRETLAKFLDGEFRSEDPTSGRPKSNERWVAMKAMEFYSEWKALNRRIGSSDHGHADEMKEGAINFVIRALVPAYLPIDAAKARECMERDKSRRN